MPFFGKYRGKVTANRDPMNLGRIQVLVPSVMGEFRNNWAMPCVPYAGKKVGWYAIPPVDANVWVEFEGGDPDYPIWSGCFWGKDELPLQPGTPDVKMFKTEGLTLTISNTPNTKSVELKIESPIVSKPLTVTFDKEGIAFRNDRNTSLRLTADLLEARNKQHAFIKMTSDAVEMNAAPVELKLSGKEKKASVKNGASSLTLASAQVEIKQGSAGFKMSGAGIEMNSTPAAVKLSSAGVSLSSGTEKVNLGPGAIEVSNGIGSVKVSPASVNINNGALEVT